MGYYKHLVAVAVPASKVAEFNAILERHGYGPNNLVADERLSLVEKGKSVVTHYLLTVHADDGLLSALKMALTKANENLASKGSGKLLSEMIGSKRDVAKLEGRLIADIGTEKKVGGGGADAVISK